MGQNQTIQKCNFEDIQEVMKKNISNNEYMLVNTLDSNQQGCLIKNTTLIENEERIINKYLNSYKLDIYIFIYGKNCNDISVVKKYQQLISLGFTNIFIYSGGLFEWLCLQDIYGDEIFPTTSEELDILKYKSECLTKKYLIKDV